MQSSVTSAQETEHHSIAGTADQSASNTLQSIGVRRARRLEARVMAGSLLLGSG